MNRLHASFLAIALVGAASSAKAADIALTGGDIYTVSGALIQNGTVIIRGDRIFAVGKDLPIASSAKVIDCKGKWITPGLIESESRIGLVEISRVESTADYASHVPDPIRASVRAADAINLRSSLIAVARRHGVTSAVSRPSGGLITGRSAWVDLVGIRSRHAKRAVNGAVALNVNLGESGARAIGKSRATAITHLRRVFDDARVYRRFKSAFTKRALYQLSASRIDLEALQDAITGRTRVVISVSRASDILSALEWAKSERLQIALLGAEEGWLVADSIAAAKVPVIVDPTANLPHRFEARNARSDNATELAKAGVKVAISTGSSHLASNLRFLLGNAVRAGLPRELALRAGTLTPAEIFGVARQYGSIDRGKKANIVVWTGDPFEPSSWAETVIIRGEIQPTESRQTRLAQRYIRSLGLK